MDKLKSAINFRTGYYEVILDEGRVSFVDVNAPNATVNVNSGPKKIRNPEAARKTVVNYLLRRPDPGMTFSD